MNDIKTKRCSNCDADIDETKFFLHERMCANIVKKCQCGEIIQIEQMEEHIKDAHTDVNCKYCRKGFNKKKLVDHEKTCNAKLKTCRFCEMEISGYDIKDHEKTCGSKTETCSICKSQVMIIEFEDHTLSCSAKESNRLKNDQIAKEKIREDKIRRDREEEKKRIEEIQRNERRIEEEKRKNKEEKINEEIKKKAAEDKKRMEEKKEDKRKLEEENRRKVLKNEIRNNEITSNKPKFIDINKHSEISDSKDIIKNIIKNPIAEKKDIRVKTEITQSKIIYKNGTDYIDKNFKNNPQTTINNQNSKIESRASGIKIDKRIPVTLESKIKPNQPTHLKNSSLPTLQKNNDSSVKEHNQIDFATDELIRELQLQEDEKLARELMNEKLYNNGDEEYANRISQMNKGNDEYDDEEMARKMQEELYATRYSLI